MKGVLVLVCCLPCVSSSFVQVPVHGSGIARKNRMAAEMGLRSFFRRRLQRTPTDEARKVQGYIRPASWGPAKPALANAWPESKPTLKTAAPMPAIEIDVKPRASTSLSAETPTPKVEPNASAIVDFGAAIFGATLSAAGAVAQESLKVLLTGNDEEAGAAAADVQLEQQAAKEEEEETPLEENMPFLASPKFDGPKSGFVFKTGPEGIGYYNREYSWE